jgi:hypothetical protein
MARPEVSMGLPARQRKVLDSIESALHRSDPRLASLFAIFTRLNRDEEMPRLEQVRARAVLLFAGLRRRTLWINRRARAASQWLAAPQRARLRAALFFPFAMAVMASAILIGSVLPGGVRCSAAASAAGSSHPPGKARLCRPILVNPALYGR